MLKRLKDWWTCQPLRTYARLLNSHLDDVVADRKKAEDECCKLTTELFHKDDRIGELTTELSNANDRIEGLCNLNIRFTDDALYLSDQIGDARALIFRLVEALRSTGDSIGPYELKPSYELFEILMDADSFIQRKEPK